jgi:hypothetical protein
MEAFFKDVQWKTVIVTIAIIFVLSAILRR